MLTMDNENVWQAAAADVSNTINAFSNQLANERLARENREFQRDTSIQMWNMQNAYDDPSAAMERLRKAGINPFVAAASVANVNHAGELSAPTQQAIPASPFVPAGSGFYQMAMALSALSQSENTNVQTEELKATLASRIQRDILETDAAKLQFELDLAFRPLERSEGMRQLKANIEKTFNEASLALEQGNVANMEYSLKNMQRYLTELQAVDQLTRNQFLPQLMLDTIKELQTRTGVNLATQNELNSRSVYNQAMTLLTNEERKQVETQNASLPDLLREKLEEAQRHNDWYFVTKLFETLGTLFSGSASMQIPITGSSRH